MSSEECIGLNEEYLAHNYSPLHVVYSKAQGIWVWDPEGNKYMDLLGAYSAVSQGHSHPKIIKAAHEQLDKVTLSARAFYNDQLGKTAKYLCETFDFDKFLPMNSGTEAVCTALKTARKWGYKKKGIQKDKAEIIICSNNFHGRTITITGFSTEEQFKEGFGPFTPGFKIIPFNDAEALEQAINENTAAFMVEPIQAEGGIIVPDSDYLKKCQEICRKHNVLFILDEVQTGLSRTGKLFAYMHDDAKPDILILGKALSGGVYPVSGIFASNEIMDVFTPGDHGSTFGGNPLAMAIAKAAVEVLIEEKMSENAAELGGYFLNKLKTELNSPIVETVRGQGLLIGIELKPEAGKAKDYCKKLIPEGILCYTSTSHAEVIRIAPPLCIKKEELDLAFEKIKKVLEG